MITVQTIVSVCGIEDISSIPTTPNQKATLESHDIDYALWWQEAFAMAAEKIDNFEISTLLAGSMDETVETAMNYCAQLESYRRYKAS